MLQTGEEGHGNLSWDLPKELRPLTNPRIQKIRLCYDSTLQIKVHVWAYSSIRAKILCSAFFLCFGTMCTVLSLGAHCTNVFVTKAVGKNHSFPNHESQLCKPPSSYVPWEVGQCHGRLSPASVDLMWHKRDLEPPRQVGPHCSSCRAQKRWECMHAEACLVTGGQVSEVAFLLVCVFQDALSTMLIVTSRICIGMYLSHSVWRQWIRCPCGYEGATMDLRLCAIEGFCWCGVLQISWLHLLNSALHSWLHWNVSLSPAAPYFIATVLRSWKHLELPLRFEDTLYSLVPTLAASTSSG